MKPLTRAIIRYNVQIGIYLAFFAASLFVPAGQSVWKMGWIYLAINALSMFANSLILLLRNPGLFQERVDRKGKRDCDRILAGIMSFFGPISICIVSGLNFRHQWPPQFLHWPNNRHCFGHPGLHARRMGSGFQQVFLRLSPNCEGSRPYRLRRWCLPAGAAPGLSRGDHHRSRNAVGS